MKELMDRLELFLMSFCDAWDSSFFAFFLYFTKETVCSEIVF